MAVVGIFGKQKHPDVEALARDLSRLAKAAGWEVWAETSLETDLVMPPADLAARADLVVVLGGDGTLIRVVRLLDDRHVPIFGVNLGFMGYLTEFTVEEAAEQFARVLGGGAKTAERVRLQADLIRDGQELVSAKVLNDVVVSVFGMSRIIEISIEIDGAHVTTCRADGLIVSSPTGSTAYSLSAGGPIVAPGVPAILITPICPHTLTMRPLVVSAESQIRLWVERNPGSVQATFDGQEVEKMQAGDVLQIGRAPGRVLLVQPPRDYFQLLRAKLKWGQR